MTSQKKVEERMEKAYKLFESGGISMRGCSIAVGVTYRTVQKYFRERYGDNLIKKRRVRQPPSKLCTLCGNPPTERDRGRLTLSTRIVPGERHFVCSDCLLPSEDEDKQELRQRFAEESGSFGLEDKLEIETCIPNSNYKLR